MFTRHLFAAAALMAATLSAQADVISTSPDTLAAATASTGLASNMSIVDAGASLSGTGLAGILASSDSTTQFALVRGVEGLYMLASRVNAPAESATGDTPSTSPTDVAITVPPASTDDLGTGVTAPVDAGGVLADVDASAVPEPSSVALMLAGMLGAVGFTRGRKQS